MVLQKKMQRICIEYIKMGPDFLKLQGSIDQMNIQLGEYYKGMGLLRIEKRIIVMRIILMRSIL